MPDIRASEHIAGVKIVRLTPFEDGRGRFLETFRKEWFPERSWDIIQTNRSDSQPDVLRGIHYHHHQVDYWYPHSGRIRVGLYDLRRESPTRGKREVLELGEREPSGLFVPPGVGHGFLALTPCTLVYMVDRYYDEEDELGVAWDDPEMAIPWGITSPVLSPRDRKNPRLAEIPEARLPR